jgi:hypothetical protein
MKAKTILFLILISFIGITSYVCKQKENPDNLKTNLDKSIKESKAFLSLEL